MIGVLFDVFLTKEQREIITPAARKCAFATNALWQEMRKKDPITPEEIIAGRKQKEETGKFPKREKFVFQADDGRKASAYCKSLADGLGSRVYDAVAHHVGNLYFKQRWEILTFQRSIPVTTKPTLRIRKGGVFFGREKETGYLTVKVVPYPGKWMTLSIRLRGRNPHTMQWIDGLIARKESPSECTIKLAHRKGKWQWQLAVARPRMDDEVAKSDPIPGRILRVFAPLDQQCFIKLQTNDEQMPWGLEIDGADLKAWNVAYDQRRRRMGRHWRQTPVSGAHGHGRKRAMLGRDRLSERYDNAAKNWIEQKSHYIAEKAREWRCESVQVERLQDRNPSSLMAGAFPYFRLVERIICKCKERNMKSTTFGSLDAGLCGPEEREVTGLAPVGAR